MGRPEMNRSATGGTRSSLRFTDEGALIHPPYQGDCGRHGTDEQHVTSGELAESPGGTAVSGPISVSEGASDTLSVVERTHSSHDMWQQPRDRSTGDRSGQRKAASQDHREK